jgi:hypothetical protein
LPYVNLKNKHALIAQVPVVQTMASRITGAGLLEPHASQNIVTFVHSILQLQNSPAHLCLMERVMQEETFAPVKLLSHEGYIVRNNKCIDSGNIAYSLVYVALAYMQVSPEGKEIVVAENTAILDVYRVLRHKWSTLSPTETSSNAFLKKGDIIEAMLALDRKPWEEIYPEGLDHADKFNWKLHMANATESAKRIIDKHLVYKTESWKPPLILLEAITCAYKAHNMHQVRSAKGDAKKQRRIELYGPALEECWLRDLKSENPVPVAIQFPIWSKITKWKDPSKAVACTRLCQDLPKCEVGL